MKEFSGFTHGFVGADLAALCREASLLALKRLSQHILGELHSNSVRKSPLEREQGTVKLKRIHSPRSFGDPVHRIALSLDKLVVTRADVEAALTTVRPSTLREVSLSLSLSPLSRTTFLNFFFGLEGVSRRTKSSMEGHRRPR